MLPAVLLAGGPRNGGVPGAACARIEHDVNYGIAGAALLRAWLAVAGEAGRGPAQDLVLLLKLTSWCACGVHGSPPRDHRHGDVSGWRRARSAAPPRGRRSSTSEPHATPKLRSCAPPERGTDRPDGAGRRDHIAAELLRERLGHDADPSSEATASQARSQPTLGGPCCVALDRRGVNVTRARTSERWEATRIPAARRPSSGHALSGVSPTSGLDPRRPLDDEERLARSPPGRGHSLAHHGRRRRDPRREAGHDAGHAEGDDHSPIGLRGGRAGPHGGWSAASAAPVAGRPTIAARAPARDADSAAVRAQPASAACQTHARRARAPARGRRPRCRPGARSRSSSRDMRPP